VSDDKVDDRPTFEPQINPVDLFQARLGHLVPVPPGKQPTSRGLMDRLTTLEPQE